MLEALYEQEFLDSSYGFRPGRSAHDALRALVGATHRGEVNWVLEMDIVSFFDSLRRPLEYVAVRETFSAEEPDGGNLLVRFW